MTDLQKGKMYGLLPPNFRDDNEVKAVCYALDRLHECLYDRIKKTEIWSHIEGVPEDVADYLAAELRTPFYFQNLDLKTKRDMVARTLIWYGKLGTREVIEEIIRLALGSGEVSEWFEHGGKPFTFRVKTSIPLREDSLQEFMDLLRWVKNTRSHLEKLTVERSKELDVYAAHSMKDRKSFQIGFDKSNRVGDLNIYAGFTFKIIRRRCVTWQINQTYDDTQIFTGLALRQYKKRSVRFRSG